MEGVALAATSLLKGFTASIQKDQVSQLDGKKTAGMCKAIMSKRLLAEAPLQGASQTTRQQFNLCLESWFLGLIKALQQADKAQQQQLLCPLLGASASVCDAAYLLLNYQSWLTTLLDLIKAQRDAILSQASGSADTVSNGAKAEQQPAKKRAHTLLQPSASSTTVNAGVVVALSKAFQASCHALIQLCTRLAEFMEVGGVKRETAALASRACGMLIPIITASATARPMFLSCSTASIQVVLCLINCIPSSLRNHAASLETALATAMVGGPLSEGKQSSHRVRVAAAAALAALPRVHGDAASYSDLFRRFLLSFHDVLDVLFMGLDDAAAAAACRTPLTLGPSVAPAAADAVKADAAAAQDKAASKRAAALLPLETLLGDSPDAHRRVHGRMIEELADLALAIIEAALKLLTTPFPVPVPLPSGPLLQAATRVLRFSDASVLASGRVPSSTGGFQQLQASLPYLHASSLKLLHQLLHTAGLSMLPLHAGLARLLSDILRRLHVVGPGATAYTNSTFRAGLFHLAAAACQCQGGGIGISRTIAPDALRAITVEFYGWVPNGLGTATASATTAAATLMPAMSTKAANKKARLAEAADTLDAAATAAATAAAAAGPAAALGAGGGAAAPSLAALRLLEALVATAGPMLPAALRTQADALAFHVAATAAEAAEHGSHEPGAMTAAQLTGLSTIQAAAYRTLLATVLTPLTTRPPFLSQALHLFHEGCSSSSAPVAAVCWQATRNVDALIHPRSTPITSVKVAATGLEDMPALPRPNFWTAIMAAGNPSVIPTVAGLTQPAVAAQAATEPQAVEEQWPQAFQPAKAAAQPPVASPASKPVEPQQQLQMPVSAPVSGNSAAKGGVPVVPVANGSTSDAAASVPAPSIKPTQAPVKVASYDQQPTAQPEVAQQARAADRQHQEQASRMVGSSPAGLAFGPESSDSEGSLPDIDMGGGSDSDSE